MSTANTSPFLRTSREFPEDIHQLSIETNKSYVDVASAVNARTIGLFPVNIPAVTGESWFLSNRRQQTLRQTYIIGAIAAGGTQNIPTGITTFSQFSRIYGTVVTNVVDYRPLPYVDSATVTNQISVTVALVGGVQNIIIQVGATSPPVTGGIVVLEWLNNLRLP